MIKREFVDSINTLSKCFDKSDSTNDRALGQALAKEEFDYHSGSCNTLTLKKLRDSIKEIRFVLHSVLNPNQEKVSASVSSMQKMVDEDLNLQQSCVKLYKRFVDLFIGLEIGLSQQLDKWLCIQTFMPNS